MSKPVGSLRNAKRTLFIASSVAVIATLTVAAVMYRNHQKFVVHPTELCHEDDIYRSVSILLNRICKANDPANELNQLSLVMKKLHVGWEGFIVDGYHPVGFTSQDLLSFVYWEIARAGNRPDCANRQQLVELLLDARPTNGGPLLQGYNNTLLSHGFEEYIRSP